MDELGVRIRTNTHVLIHRVVMRIGGSLLATTPVNTGAALLSWNTSVQTDGGSFWSIMPPRQPGESKGTRRAMVMPMAKSRMKSSLRNVGKTSARIPVHLKVYITTAIPYMPLLNRGYSPQAKAGFIEAAIHQGVAIGKNVNLVDKVLK